MNLSGKHLTVTASIASGTLSRLALAALIVLSAVSAGIAQPAVNMETLRQEELNNPVDRQKLERWVGAQFDALYELEDPLRASSTFYRQMLEHYTASDAKATFKTGLAEFTAQTFLARYNPDPPAAQRTSPVPIVAALMVLKAYGQPSALPVFTRALQDKEASIRLAAADGLLAADIEAGEWGTLLPALQSAAASEPDPVALGRMIRVITRENGPPAAQATQAILQILNTRLDRFEQQGEFPAKADADAVTWLGRRFGNINDEQMQKDIRRSTARLLADAVHVYVDKNTTEASRNELARVIAAVEQQLRLMTRGGTGLQPSVTSALFERSKDERIAGVELQIERWIGTDATAGYLNEDPFNLPRGLGIERPPPSTQPATENTE